jgi:hypothetical protein
MPTRENPLWDDASVSAFITVAVRHEFDRRSLSDFVDELADELGPVDEAEVARYSDLFVCAARCASHSAYRGGFGFRGDFG